MKLSTAEIHDIKELFLECCTIDNPSKNEQKMVSFICKYLRKYRIKPEIDHKKNIYFKLPGKGKPLILNAHIDCVQPCISREPKFDGEIFFSKGETILGADDLVGVASILKIIDLIKKKKIVTRPLEIMFTTMEEIGGGGIKSFDFSDVDSKEAIVFDSLAPVGNIIVKSPTKYNLELNFRGIPVHGQGADKGVSAIKMMAELLHLLPLGKVKKNVTLNIGLLRGGQSLNTVPGEATATGAFKIVSQGEIRSETREEVTKLLDLIHTKISKVQKKYPHCEIIFNYQLNRPGYSFSEKDDFIQYIKKAIRNAGIKPKLRESFGVSDANTFNAMGIKTVLIGTGVKNAHTINETVALSELVKLTEIGLELIASEDKA